MREIKVVPYDDCWATRYEFEKEIIASILGDVIEEIHHFGSTSIKGMHAKPIIDIMVIVRDITIIDNFNDTMSANGFTPRGENGISGRRYFVRYAEDNENHLTHVHIYESDNPHVKNELMFCKFLSVDRESFESYEKVKLEAGKKYRYSPLEYTNAKTDCVNEIMKKINMQYL